MARPVPPRRWGPTTRYDRLARAYYARLAQNPAFRQDLDALFAAAPPTLETPGQAVVQALEQAVQGALLPPLATVWQRYHAESEPYRARLEQFRARWPLPTTAPRDLAWWRRLARAGGTEEVAAAYPHGALGTLPPGSTVPVLPSRPTQIHPHFPPLDYDPLVDTRAELHKRFDAAVAAVRAAVLEEARAAERVVEAAGWHTTPPHWETPGTVHTIAHRLYLRACCGWSWGAIADHPAVGGKREAIARQVRAAAQLLGIALPQTPRRSR